MYSNSFTPAFAGEMRLYWTLPLNGSAAFAVVLASFGATVERSMARTGALWLSPAVPAWAQMVATRLRPTVSVKLKIDNLTGLTLAMNSTSTTAGPGLEQLGLPVLQLGLV